MSFLNSTTLTGPDPTRPDMSAPATRSPRKSGPCLIPLHGPTDFVCNPTGPDPQTESVHVEIERTSLRSDRVGGLVGDPSGPWVWSGRVLVVEFGNDTTSPDQLATKSSGILTDPQRTQRTLSVTRVSDKVWSGPSSGIRTYLG